MNFLKALTGSAIVASLLVSAGCELIVAPDRTKIGTGGGGEGGAGGTTTTSDTTGGGGSACTPVDDGKECTDDVCNGDTPENNPKALGTACTQDSGKVCDDAGNCVACNEDADCTAPQVCSDAHTCVDPTCRDGEQNGDETDVDCGGSCAPALKCADGDGCGVPGDCVSGVCTGDVCQAPTCMDGVQNGDETDEDCGGACAPTSTCDDGQGCSVGADCTSGVCGPNDTCSAPICGDGVVNQPTESCDDGNMDPDDECANNCSIPGCGNGELGANEDCDDGNETNGDGCDDGPGGNCTETACGNGVVTDGEECDDPGMPAANGDGCDNGPGGNCTVSACGNGVVAGTEVCDDGNNTLDDGCDDGPTGNCTVTACGNGIVTGTEVCDDGNSTLDDGCDDGPTGNCTVTACGNGIVAGTEVCDDGNQTNDDGCDDGPTGNCTETACGNGVVAGDEACDDGNSVPDDECANNCTIPGCGNGEIVPPEVCDDNNDVNGDGCDNNCTPTGCPNGIQTGTEACDDGNMVNGDMCDSNCTVPACGNGAQSPTEDCDDGNQTNGDGCDDGPLGNCTETACGNGVKTGTEACDDGNLVDGDCCSSTCTIEPGCEVEPNNTCGAQTVLPAFAGTPLTTTAKGSVNPGASDIDLYSFTIPGTGPTTIKIDTYFGTPGTCASDSSNDVYVELRAAAGCSPILAEDDDDGPGFCSLIDGAGADTGARNLTPGPYIARVDHSTGFNNANNYTMVITILSACGNGVVETGESCDDGNNTNSDGCSSICDVEPNFYCTGTPLSTCVPAEINCNDGIDNNGVNGIDEADPTCQLPAYFPACPAGAPLLVYLNNRAFPIPDGNTTGITSQIPVANTGIIARTNVVFDVTHTYDADLDFWLVRPTAAQIDICSDNGGEFDNFTNTVLSTACASNVTGGTAPFSGCFNPENAATVNAINGTAANGTWGLRVRDQFTPDPGTLNYWRLAFCMDVDECALETDNCNANATCTNTPGSFTCACNAGFMGDGVTCTPICGDGLVVAGEACDDGGTTNGNGCSSTCTIEPGFNCTGAPSTCTPICGDGLRVGTETCDDANTDPNDGCSATCQEEDGYTCTGAGEDSCVDDDECMLGTDDCSDDAACDNTPGSFTCTCNNGFSGDGVTCDPTCGDGLRVGSETCDDANTDPNDGCSATCQEEDGYTCTGAGEGSCVDDDECTLGTDDCVAPETCVNTPGSFTCDCNAPNDVCAGVCVDTDTDENNCGDCDIVCDPGDTCVAGICTTP